MKTNATTANARRNSGIAAAAVSFAMALMLACSPIASAAEANAIDPMIETPAATQVLNSGNGGAVTELQDEAAHQGVSSASKVSFKKLSPNKAIADYCYAGKCKMKYYTKLSKPKVKISGSKKIITVTQTITFVKPSQAVAKKILSAKKGTGGTYVVPFDRSSQYALNSFSDCKVKFGKVKCSNYTKLASGYAKRPMKYTRTITITVPKNYKGTSIALFTYNKSNNVHYKYAMYVG